MMISNRTWTRTVTSLLSAFLLLNFLIWSAFTRDILTFQPYYNGGLDRMGYITGSKHYRKPESTLSRHHVGNKEYRGSPVDVLTIGDSFSNVKNNGKDPLYQDWLASLYDLDVLNVHHLKGKDEFSTIVTLLNSGYLDIARPRAIIIQSVERYAIAKYGKEIDFDQTMPLADIQDYYRTAGYPEGSPKLSFVNTGNFKFLLYNVLYWFSDNAFISKVYVRELDTALFSVKNGRRLLFYHEDLEYLPVAIPETVTKLNDNFNRLAILLKKRGITLYFLPAPDKYTIYYDHIIDNPYPKSIFFELLRAQPDKKYVFIDAKKILLELVRRGETDVYYADDTHWSWKASKSIAEHIRI